MIQVRSANPLFYFQELWDRPNIDEVNNWAINTEVNGAVTRAIFNGRGSAYLNAPAVGDSAILGSLMGFNCVPNFMAAENDKEDYIEKKLIIEFTLLEKAIGGVNGIFRAGLNELNNDVMGNDAVFVQQDNTDIRVVVRDGGVSTPIVTAETPDKVHIEIGSGFIEFYFGTVLINRFIAGLPDDFMYLWFWADDNASFRLGPVLAWYEKVDIERL